MQQALKTVIKGYAKLYPNKRAAERKHDDTHPAPLGNIRNRKADRVSWNDRRILDLKESRASKRARLHERVVLPRAVDHARDMV